MSSRGYVPRRGDVVWLDFSPQRGHEQAGWRPALVISPESYNRICDLAFVCPITSRVKGYPWEVALPPGLGAKGVILVDHMKSLDWRARRAEFTCAAPEAIVAEVLDRLAAIIS